MSRPDRKQAVKRFGDELQNVLDSCVRDADGLKRAFNKGPLGTGEEAVKFSSTMQTEVEQVHNNVPPLVRLSTDTPRAGDMLDAAYAHLKAITNVFNCFEERLESAYDIPPVVLPQPKPEVIAVREEGAPEPVVTEVGSLSSWAPGSAAKLGMTPVGRTPRSGRKKKDDMPIPATPRLEDFGLSHDDVCQELRGLGMSSTTGSTEAVTESFSSRHEGTPGQKDSLWKGALRNTGGPGGSIGKAQTQNGRGRAESGVEVDLDGDFEENVQKSMSALGIETPLEVAEKFETRRHQALTQMMVTTTPRLKSGGVARTMDYTGLAGGYYKSGTRQAEVETHRQLNFDETPRVGGDVGAEMRRRIRQGFDGLGFWRDKVSCETLEEAGMVLQREGERVFDKRELSGLLNSMLPGISCYSVIASLTKMQVLVMEKKVGEEATYRVA